MTMARQSLRAVPAAEGSSDITATPTDTCRDNLSERFPSLDQTCPASLDLAATLHSDLHSRLAGCASQFAGRRSPAHFREGLRSDRRGLDVVDLAYLAVQPMAEPRAAIAAFVATLAHAVDCRVTPDGNGDVVLGAVMVTLIQHSGATLAVVQAAREDGRIDDSERPKVVTALETLQRQVADLLEAVRQTGERA